MSSSVNLQAKEAVTYRRSGTSGHAPKTLTGKASALIHFNEFLRSKCLGSWDTLNEETLCNISLFQEFGTYVSEYARDRRKVEGMLLYWFKWYRNRTLLYLA
jgi:hypothetical protein